MDSRYQRASYLAITVVGFGLGLLAILGILLS